MEYLLQDYTYGKPEYHPVHGEGIVREITPKGVLVQFQTTSKPKFEKLFKSDCYSPGDDLIVHIQPQQS